jgi:GTPase SAR1 family protein
MIVVFYGKRNSGKTTLCREFYGWVKQNLPLRCHYLDADKLRFVYGLKGFSEQTERALVQKAMEISRYEESLNDVVLISISFAYKDQREVFEENRGILWIPLTHDESQRPTNKKEFENAQFEKLENEIDTSQNDVKSALNTVIQRYKDFCVTSQYKGK